MATEESLGDGTSVAAQSGGIQRSEDRVAFFSMESPGRRWVFPYSRVLFAHADAEGKRFFMRTMSHDLWVNGQKLDNLITLFQQERVADIRPGSNRWGTVEEIEINENPAGMFH
ncbi:MAG: hypothetical protein AB7T14_03695 [Candidatus Methylacidiphilaceae bacterium]